jgi:hypothetical protein
MLKSIPLFETRNLVNHLCYSETNITAGVNLPPYKYRLSMTASQAEELLNLRHHIPSQFVISLQMVGPCFCSLNVMIIAIKETHDTWPLITFLFVIQLSRHAFAWGYRMQLSLMLYTS